MKAFLRERRLACAAQNVADAPSFTGRPRPSRRPRSLRERGLLRVRAGRAQCKPRQVAAQVRSGGTNAPHLILRSEGRSPERLEGWPQAPSSFGFVLQLA